MKMGLYCTLSQWFAERMTCIEARLVFADGLQYFKDEVDSMAELLFLLTKH